MTVQELIDKLLKLQFDATVRILNDEGVINDLEAAWLAEENLVFIGSKENAPEVLNLPAVDHTITQPSAVDPDTV